MKDYKRLTGKPVNGDKGYMFNCDSCPRKGASFCGTYDCLDMVCDRLGELEDKIEQGRFVELPCKVGDTIYRILPRCDNINKCSEFDQHICSRSNCDWHIRETKFALNMLNYIGDYYFTTKAEAEAKLAELRGGE